MVLLFCNYLITAYNSMLRNILHSSVPQVPAKPVCKCLTFLLEIERIYRLFQCVHTVKRQAQSLHLRFCTLYMGSRHVQVTLNEPLSCVRVSLCHSLCIFKLLLPGKNSAGCCFFIKVFYTYKYHNQPSVQIQFFISYHNAILNSINP